MHTGAYKACLWCGLIVALISPLGCGGGGAGPNRLKTVAAKGTVTLDGKPFGPGSIELIPASEGKDRYRMASGDIDAQGAFTLGSYDKTDGAVPGKYRVQVTAKSSDGMPAMMPTVIQEFTIEVTDKGSSDLKIDLKAGKGGSGPLTKPTMDIGASTKL